MQKSEKKTKIILWAIAALTVLGCALWMLLPHGGTTDCTAEIWIDGKMVRSIYLPQAAEEEISLAEYGKEVLLVVSGAVQLVLASLLLGKEVSLTAPWFGFGLDFSLRWYHFSGFITSSIYKIL